jgi:hypothetical protein
MVKIPIRYIPFSLKNKDKKKQLKMLMRSRKDYKKQKYSTRKQLPSFQSKVSPHILKARSIYKTTKILPNAELSKATGCSIDGLKQIVKKGEGAYFSSGSRPNQTAQSWGLARLASSITGGKAAAVDFSIIEKTCNHKKKAYKLAVQSRKKNGFGKGKTKKHLFNL